MILALPDALLGPSDSDKAKAASELAAPVSEIAAAQLRSAHRREAILVAIYAAVTAPAPAPKAEPAKGKPAKGG